MDAKTMNLIFIGYVFYISSGK